MNSNAVIIGAGPAGLAAADTFTKHDIQPIVFEKSDKVGGISRTEVYNGYYFDMGGHRFFTKNQRIKKLWQEMLGENLVKVPRTSRIYYNGRYFDYPLHFMNALSNLGVLESSLFFLSYVKAQLWPCSEEENFEQWVSNRFGNRLYRTFFKHYTEKVWGIPCHQIQSDWAAQRIQGLSPISILTNALFGAQKSKSLIEEFDYPIKGSGMMWQSFQQAVEARGGQIELNAEVIRLNSKNRRIESVIYNQNNKTVELPVGNLISSIPINKLVTSIEPRVPKEVFDAAQKLSYRAFVIVLLIVNKKDLFPDQWIYIHSPDVKVGRIQNFKNWSTSMIPNLEQTSVGMEYFCNAGDEIWNMSDAEFKDTASGELHALGLCEIDSVVDCSVVRQPNAYPVYDQGYKRNLETIRNYTGTIENLQTIGRNGMHRYNNMDHSMFTGILAAENVLGANHNLWNVNEDAEYLEKIQK